MADSMSAAALVAPLIRSADIARAEKFVRERFLHEGEDPAVVLAPGTARRRALDQALMELDEGSKHPFTEWRRAFSLLLGLERLLSEDEPRLADGTILSSHQVDALSGTLVALLAESQRAANGNGKTAELAAPELLASSATFEVEASSRLSDDAGLDSKEPADESDADGHVDAPADRVGGEERVGDGGERVEGDGRVDGDARVDGGARVGGARIGGTRRVEARRRALVEDEDAADDELEDDELAEEFELIAKEEAAESELEEDSAEELEEESDEEPRDWVEEEAEGESLADRPEDPNAAKRFWFEHATGAGKTVAALGFVEASRTGGVLILTHRRNLVDQFLGELRDRGYAKRISRPLLKGQDSAKGPVTVETYQWFVRNAGDISSAYTIVVCDEAHTALGTKTSAAIRAWTGPIFIGMTATGALIARHVTDLFPTQTSRFDLAQAARRGVIAPLRCIRIRPGAGVRTIAKVPLRRGEVDTEFDQEMLAELLDQHPFNVAAADLYKTRFDSMPGVVYAAGVRHAYNLDTAFGEAGLKAKAVSGETPKRELAQILARYERGEIDVLINAQLLAEGWNSPRATVCMHLAPTASRRVYQQRVGRVTRRHPGKEAGVVVDFVDPATKNDDPVVTLHSLLDRDVYRGGAIVVGPVRRGRGRRVRVERRVLPVSAEKERRFAVFERELWRIAVENLDYDERHLWAALAGARVTPSGWRRARTMLHFDRSGELKRRFLLTAMQRNRNLQVRIRALADIAGLRDPDAFDTAVDIIGSWPREERKEATKIMLRALAERRIGRRDQANAWIWRLAEYTREIHEEYAAQRWPETKRLLGLLVNSAGSAHARNARRLAHAARKQDRRLAAALLAAALAHTPEAEEALRGARTRMARKPTALARDLLRNFPKRRPRGARRRRKGQGKRSDNGTVQSETLVGPAVGSSNGGGAEEVSREVSEAVSEEVFKDPASAQAPDGTAAEDGQRAVEAAGNGALPTASEAGGDSAP
jgi:superfamily II DNA or RNA helicase